MDNAQKTSNALLVVLATIICTVAFLGVVLTFFDKEQRIVTTVWRPPWTAALEADFTEAGVPERATLVVRNYGESDLYGRQVVLFFGKGRRTMASAALDAPAANAFKVESEAEKAIDLDLSGLVIRDLEGDLVDKADLAEDGWYAQAVFFVAHKNAPRARMAWSDRLALSHAGLNVDVEKTSAGTGKSALNADEE